MWETLPPRLRVLYLELPLDYLMNFLRKLKINKKYNFIWTRIKTTLLCKPRILTHSRAGSPLPRGPRSTPFTTHHTSHTLPHSLGWPSPLVFASFPHKHNKHFSLIPSHSPISTTPHHHISTTIFSARSPKNSLGTSKVVSSLLI